ncbi:MAG TPA: hypothetical protein VIA62_26660 [Thermoanaerobaculia bacterium]|nr:hypothetical protein [Thermoanaerobaculia bacterium]
MLDRLRREDLPTRAVLLAGAINEDELLEALQLGARGVVLKEKAGHASFPGTSCSAERP